MPNGYKLSKIYVGQDLVRPYEDPRLCFTAKTAGSTIKLNKYGSPTTVTLQTSTDGNNRSNYTFGNTITLSNIGDKVYRRNTSTSTTGFSTGSNRYYYFTMTGTIEASGDIGYLLNINSTTDINYTACYYCFLSLFYNCSSLVKAPQLPATTLCNGCYWQMFYGCSNLEIPPKLPALSIPESAYYAMFQNCTKLSKTPKLPATTLLGIRCYYSMFTNCTSLTAIPELPATTLKQECYSGMFMNDTTVKLSATQEGEYQTPYRIPSSGTGTTATNALQLMFSGTGGTFAGAPTINTTYYTSNAVV